MVKTISGNNPSNNLNEHDVTSLPVGCVCLDWGKMRKQKWNRLPPQHSDHFKWIHDQYVCDFRSQDEYCHIDDLRNQRKLDIRKVLSIVFRMDASLLNLTIYTDISRIWNTINMDPHRRDGLNSSDSDDNLLSTKIGNVWVTTELMSGWATAAEVLGTNHHCSIKSMIHRCLRA